MGSSSGVFRRFLVSVALAGLACAGPSPEAPDLEGVWRTQATSHRDRKLEIQPAWLVFGVGGEGTASHPRDGTEVEPHADGGLLCTLYYRTDDGSRTHLRVVYEAGPPERLRFPNRAEVWTREGGGMRPGRAG